MPEKYLALSVIIFIILMLRTQNSLVQVYVGSFTAYFFLGWVFAKYVDIWQLTFYSISALSLMCGVVMGNSFIAIRKLQKADTKRIDFSIPEEGIQFNPLLTIALISCVFVAFCSYLILILLHGLPVLNIGDRTEVSGFFTYLIGLIWIIYPFIYVWLPKRYLLAATFGVGFIMLTMGYRTPLVVTILMFIFLNIKYGRFVLTRNIKLLGCLLLLSVLTLYPLLRFQDDPEAVVKLLANLDMPEELFVFAPFILVFAEGASVVKGIAMILPDVGLQYGQFTLAGFSTVLPGEQTHSRTLLSYWLGRTNWQESTTTSSILGQFYLEVGQYGTYFLCFFLGLFICLGSNRFLTANRPIKSAPFLIVFILLTISIHTGMLDPLILYVLLIYMLIIFISKMGDVIFKK
ncbi:hypothetical protein NDQ71_10065 [Pseudoalteromonas sp. KG3]|uniref:hypothetical protein n=1 Tax=Pseudoalteromonas sp. KG3 TaxID=2951137 RepID=UPI0026597672|nr:hypothetical protein [Pseudoalteromonas sp. KG3]WKD22033.1 hypothetical protein NDQ71_10065 [Pseudoalteromonas sp. KG3]